jgi:3-dehydroquinate dehydratase II
MARRVLVLHGPNLNLEAVLGRPLPKFDEELVQRGADLELEVETFQASGEAALLEKLFESHRGLLGVIVNPSSLAPISFALADALEALGLPSIEVQLRHGQKSRGRSALKRVVEKQFYGQGVEGYFKALQALAKVEATTDAQPEKTDETQPVDRTLPTAAHGKTIGRVKQATPVKPGAKGKTIGRRSGAVAGALAPAPAGSITRALVREQVRARLAKTLNPDEFAQWARGQWAAIQRGTPTEDPKLEDILLLLSTSAKASDHVILSYAAKLES